LIAVLALCVRSRPVVGRVDDLDPPSSSELTEPPDSSSDPIKSISPKALILTVFLRKYRTCSNVSSLKKVSGLPYHTYHRTSTEDFEQNKISSSYSPPASRRSSCPYDLARLVQHSRNFELGTIRVLL
jgi:hypothetical protein